MSAEPSFFSTTHDYILGNTGDVRNATTFADNMKLPVHRWYRYSAGYSSEWATKLIRYWGAMRVLDPFGGSGTTCLAAQECGVSSYATDVHPTVSRIARAKLAWQADRNEFSAVVREVLATVMREHSVELPNSPLVAKCFPDRTQLVNLLRVRDAVCALPLGEPTSELAWLAFVSIIRAASPAGTAQWQYVLPNRKKRRVAEPISAFQEASNNFMADMKTRCLMLGDVVPSAQMLTTDARTLDGVPDGWADTIITSPPYANNYDYADALRLEQIVLGDIQGWSDLRPLRDMLLKSATQNIGSWKADEALSSPLLKPILKEFLPVYDELAEVRKSKGGRKAYHVMLAGYFFDHAKVFHALRQKTVSGAKICYVVGDSAPYGIHAPVERWLGELAIAAGFSSWAFSKARDRNIKWKNRKHTHPLHEGYLWIEG